MRKIPLFSLIAILLVLATSTVAHSGSTKESVTIDINANLLKQARAQDLDLASILEKQLKAKFGEPTDSPQIAYLPFLTKTFDNFDTLMFAPLKITPKTPKEEVKTICKAMTKNIDQLLADAKIRNSMPLPTSLEEAKKLDEFIQQRFQAFQERSAKVHKQMQSSGKIMQANCTDLDHDEKSMQKAMKTVFSGYGPTGWCQALKRKPQGQWSMNDSQNFMKYCTNIK